VASCRQVPVPNKCFLYNYRKKAEIRILEND
jgi:hypothetical protein